MAKTEYSFTDFLTLSYLKNPHDLNDTGII